MQKCPFSFEGERETTGSMNLPQVDILNVKISAINLDLACAAIDEWIQTRRKVYVCVAPVSTIVSCHEDEEYKGIVNNADMVTPDGMPVVWLARAKGYKSVARTYGPDLMRLVCARGQDKGYKHFFYGSTHETCARLEASLKKDFPRLSIAGMYAPPFRDLTDEENQRIVAMLNQSQADIIWVGLGSPKQDFWMARHRRVLEAPVMVGVGAAFDFVAGVKPQAPLWMQQACLEWLFRLSSEPQRLWRRYLIGNTKFLYLLLKENRIFKKR